MTTYIGTDKSAALFYDCPGAVVGSGPNDQYPGRLVVESAFSMEALAYMRRRVRVLSIESSARYPDCVALRYEWKSKA